MAKKELKRYPWREERITKLRLPYNLGRYEYGYWNRIDKLDIFNRPINKVKRIIKKETVVKVSETFKHISLF